MKFFPVILVLLTLISLPVSAQEIELEIEVTMDALDPGTRDYLVDFADELKRYVNEHRWTDVDFYGDKILVRMSINFMSGSPSGEFSAGVVVVTERRIWETGRPTEESSLLLRLMDPKWSFSFTKGQPFTHDAYQFNDLTTFIDFYMYLALGTDFDSYEPLMGSPYYQKALRATQFAQSSRRSQEWQGSSNQYSRINLVSEFMNAQYENFRTSLYWYYYEGLDFLKTDKDIAQKSIAKALDGIMEILLRTNARNIILPMWLESKSSEFCTVLDGYIDRPKVMKAMMKADPPRSERYRQCSF